MTSRLLAEITADLGPLLAFVESYLARAADPSICDFVFGNPHEMPLPGLVEAIRTHAEPKDKDWFAYKQNEREPVEAVAQSLRASHGMPFEPEDIFLTPGAFGGLSVTLRALLDPGDEVIFLSPPWFFYEPMIRIAGGRPVRVTMTEPDFAPDPRALTDAITERTRAIILNTPHNPTGRLYTTDELHAVADALRTAGRPIYLLSDESYRRILFDGRTFVSPAAVYEHTIVLYTYGKTLLAPGERLGYIALPPGLGDREELRRTMFLSQVVGGWQFPNATLQRALPDLEELSIDVHALQVRRNHLVDALQAAGYELLVPESTFYLMVRSPIPDDVAFTERLTEHDVFVGPGLIFEMPGWFRISLTANDDMVERALPAFRHAIARASAGPGESIPEG